MRQSAPASGVRLLPRCPRARHRRVPFSAKTALPTRIIGKVKASLEGRAIGILVADGSNGASIKKISKAATAAGVTVKIVAPKWGAKLFADGSMLAAEGQLAGTPFVVFDAVAVILF